MRVAYLAAGAGGMICGSCLRDNRLAATLINQGRDIILVPLYTPLRTDETNVSRGPVFYGGINVYLQQRFPFLRRLPGSVTRWLDAPRILNSVSRFAARTNPRMLGALTVSVLKGDNGRQRSALAELIEGLRSIRPDLVNLPNLMFAGVAGALKDALRVPILCTLGGEDLFLDGLPEPFRSEALDLVRTQSRHVDGFIATTNYYANHAANRFDLPIDRVYSVPMGIATDLFPDDPATPDELFTIGFLARICAEKGLENLCEAMVRIHQSGRNCRIRVAGYLSPADRPYLRRLRKFLRYQGSGSAFEYLGEISLQQKIEFLRSIHILSVPTDYPEAKGLYVLEALAAGVPVIQPRHGSFPELIEATGGGVLYDPADPDGLVDAIVGLMDDQELRASLGKCGRRAVRESFTDSVMAEETWSVYASYAAR